MEREGFYSTADWRRFRAEALLRAGYRCEAEPSHDLDGLPVRCQATVRLHVHHTHGVPLRRQRGLVFCPRHHAEFERWLREADQVAA